MAPTLVIDRVVLPEQRLRLAGLAKGIAEKEALDVVGRPHAVCGFSAGGLMNVTVASAVYANICEVLS
jgi:hypothetical protein